MWIGISDEKTQCRTIPSPGTLPGNARSEKSPGEWRRVCRCAGTWEDAWKRMAAAITSRVSALNKSTKPDWPCGLYKVLAEVRRAPESTGLRQAVRKPKGRGVSCRDLRCCQQIEVEAYHLEKNWVTLSAMGTGILVMNSS